MIETITISCPDCGASSEIQWNGVRTPLLDVIVAAIVEEIYCSSHLKVKVE